MSQQIKATYKDAIKEEFQLAINKLKTQSMPIKNAHKILIFTQALAKHVEMFEELRFKLIEKYGEKAPDGTIALNPTKTGFMISDKIAFDKEFKELLDIEIDIEGLPLNAVEDLNLTPVLTQTLLKFLTH